MRIRFAAVCQLAIVATLAVPATFAAADSIDIPARKAGMWHIKMAMGPGLPERTAKLCLDGTTDKAMMEAGLSLTKGMCEKQEMTRDGGAIVIDSVCKFGPMKSTSHIVIDGDFQSEYKIHITGAIEGGPKGMPGKTDLTQTVRWISADCSDGLKPGEMMMPGGLKIDATKLMKSIGGGG
jgi:hypothetical protein